MRIVLMLISFLMLLSCGDDVLIKPSAKLSLEYPTATFQDFKTDCNYSFKVNDLASVKPSNNCGMEINYPNMNATVYITYQKVQNNNLESLLYDAQKAAYSHQGRADGIPEKLFVNPENKTYGTFYSINGNAASQSQFYVTDSIQHFVSGSLYFNVKPNFDSIYPAVVYLREDIKKMMETMQWKN